MVNSNRFFFLFFLFLTISPLLYAQEKNYCVYFTDKNNSPYSISDPSHYLSEKAIQRRVKHSIDISESDLPVTPDYLDSLQSKGAEVLYSLKWLNAAIVKADSLEMVAINTLSFVQNYTKVARKMGTKRLSNTGTSDVFHKKNNSSYGNSYNQVHMLEGDEMHRNGFHGDDMLIAVLDAGFKNAPSLSFFNHIYSNNKVIATYDFIDQETDVYDDDDHGLEVLSVIAAYQENYLIGMAYNASFVLLRTEDGATETLIEEVHWAKGVEYADSIGADIITSSLGYNTFDNASTNHLYSEFDGNTTICAKAADIAAAKGILIITSAGNEGNTAWKYITTPADGDSVLAIGAVDMHQHYTYFSSIGPSADGRIKPDLAALGQSVVVGTATGGISSNSGTSFACPLVTGLAAGLWQAYPGLSNMQIADALRKSASQHHRPDQYLGYGIPGYIKARQYINDSIFNIGINIRIYPNPIREGILYFTSGAEYFSQAVTIKMYDVVGRQVAEDHVTVQGVRNETNINIASLRDGLYIVRFYFPDKTVKTRLLKF